MLERRVINEFYLPHDLLIQQYVFILESSTILGGYWEAIDSITGTTVAVQSFSDIGDMLSQTQEFFNITIENHEKYISSGMLVQQQEEVGMSVSEIEHYQEWLNIV